MFPINHARELNVLLRNEGGLPFAKVEDGGMEMSEYNSRGIALIDYDRDADLDITVTTFHDRPQLFRNESNAGQNRWLRVELVGDPDQGTSRNAIGTQVIARDQDGFYLWRMRTAGEGYMGSSESTLHFGLGEIAQVDREVMWPGNRTQTFAGVEANRTIRIRQGTENYEVLDR